MVISPSEEIRDEGVHSTMRKGFKRGSRGTRENTKVDESPAPTAGSAAAGGTTPLAQVATPESVKDVGTPIQLTYATDFGYTLYDLEYEDPNNDRVQLFSRVIEFSPTGFLGISPPSDVGIEHIEEFYTTLYDKLLTKAVVRDGYRHLPDTLTSGLDIRDVYALWLSAVINVRTVRALIDSTSWNDATKSYRNQWSRKNRRATEVWNDLSTFEVPQIYRMLALLHPPTADKPGGNVIITFAALKPFWDGLFDTVPTSALNLTGPGSIMLDSNGVDSILAEAEDVVRALRYCSTIAGATWATGYDTDLKYFITLMNELVYPMGLPESGQIMVDPMEFNQTLYGDAIYGTFGKRNVGVLTSRNQVGYPVIAADGSTRLVYRRGFNQLSTLVHAGFKQPWAVQEVSGSEIAGVLGLFANRSEYSNHQLYDSNAYSLWTRDTAALVPVTKDVNFDDGNALRHWMEEGGPQADHQWNEMLFVESDLEATFPIRGPAGIKSYGFHMPVEIPGDLQRSALCASWNVPFVR
jgi:hypothetical protein